MNQKDVDRFAELLEEAGFAGAYELIQEELIPLAQKKHISLLEAAQEYANQEEEQDTSWSQFFHALQKISNSSINSIDIRRPL